MQQPFWVNLLSYLIVIAAILIYNGVITSREQADTIAQLEYALETQEASASVQNSTTSTDSVSYRYNDGTYQGKAQGYGGKVIMEISIEQDVIIDIQVISAESEDAAYFDAASALIDEILETQSTDVDTVSAATFSSNGIIGAIKDALGKAER
ncbi:MAG: FMN-binding protein [Ruminococcus sp.]|nr:FMN-binding protein [Ruminococcus sp.]